MSTVKAADDVLRGPAKSKTIFPVLVLHLLAEAPDHGFGLMQRIEALCADLLAVNTNTIYPLLRRLEDRGFIVGEWEHPTKRSRRFYEITPAGRARLDQIKVKMLPYLDLVAAAVDRLRGELYANAVPLAARRTRARSLAQKSSVAVSPKTARPKSAKSAIA